ncbi:hypothetical protein M3221_00365 [Domibacillus indicus]|uniref:hypothetical protein n=1 Tax=Domibacillus indicus TaxID=1437523 RepID=UPI0020416C63|nr:hypothetical protein [Domibacillus indicus]MCM3786883.1 hypothetical protein [Domibacillus indicus]
MAEFTSVKKLDEMKMMSRGNPEKIAAYSTARKQYNETVAAYFTDDEPLPNLPSADYVEGLKAKAEEGDEADKMRYELARDRRESTEYRHNGAHEQTHQTVNRLRQKLIAGEKMTSADVKAMERAAKHQSSAENIALYAQVKRVAE